MADKQIRSRVLKALNGNWLGVPQLEERLGVHEGAIRHAVTKLLLEGAVELQRGKPFRYTLTAYGQSLLTGKVPTGGNTRVLDP